MFGLLIFGLPGWWEIGRTGWGAGQDCGTSQIKVNATKVCQEMCHPVLVCSISISLFTRNCSLSLLSQLTVWCITDAQDGWPYTCVNHHLEHQKDSHHLIHTSKISYCWQWHWEYNFLSSLWLWGWGIEKDVLGASRGAGAGAACTHNFSPPELAPVCYWGKSSRNGPKF